VLECFNNLFGEVKMGNISVWCGNSLILRIVIAFFKPETIQNSYFLKLFSAFFKGISNVLQGSAINAIKSDEKWEAAAIKRSRFICWLLLLGPIFLKIVDLLSLYIKSSWLMAFVMRVKRDIVEGPLLMISYLFLPFVLVSTALKAMFSSFTPQALALRILLILSLAVMTLMDKPLKAILGGSISVKIANKLFGFPKFDADKSEHGGFDGRLSYIAIGILSGMFYYILPMTTFVKLIGLIFFSLIIYIDPGIGMALVLFILPLTATTYSAALIGITFVSLIFNYKKIKPIYPTASIPAILFLAVATLAAAFSLMRTESLKTFPLYVIYFMAFYCAALLFQDLEKMKYAIVFSIISALIVSFIGIYQYFFVKVRTAMAWVDITQFPELSTRVYATMENPNVLAEYLGFIIPINLGLLWAAKKPAVKGLLGIITSIIALCLILTFSRGAWLGLALAVMIFAVLKEPRLLIVILVLAFVSPAFMPDVVQTRIASIGSLEDSSNAFRISIWIAALRMIKDYWLTGVGLGLSAFARVYRDYMIAGTPALHAHNLYLEMGLEMGIAGLLTFMWMIGAGLSKAVKASKTGRAVSSVIVGIIGGLAGHLLHGLFDYVWFSPRIVMLFWILFGMMVGLAADREIQEGENP
jgi:O-antigen ligase